MFSAGLTLELFIPPASFISDVAGFSDSRDGFIVIIITI